MNKQHFLTSLTFLALAGSLTAAAPLGTAFTYQGKLTDGASPATSRYDMEFKLFDDATAGSQLGALIRSAVPVTNGLFTVEVDFLTGVFTGEARWLQIGVRSNGSPGLFTSLAPRQPLNPAPYALYAPNASTANTANGVAAGSIVSASFAANAVTSGSLAANAVTSDKIADGTLTAADLSPTLASSTFWRLGGNAGTAPGPQFLGTTDNLPVEFQVNGRRALRLEPGVNGAPNIVGGSVSNRVAATVIGATIAGGGNAVGAPNRIDSDYGSVGGGYGNTIQTNAKFASLAGGYGNTIQSDAFDSSIGGGAANTIQTNAYLSTIGGGSDNQIQINAKFSTIAGGEHNTIHTDAYRSAIGGGSNHQIESNATNSFIGGGSSNTIRANAWDCTIAGGSGNLIEANAPFSAIAGGFDNAIKANAFVSTIGGGSDNTIMAGSSVATIAGGSGNAIWPNAWDSTIGGGKNNTIQGEDTDSTIGGGFGNTIGTYQYESIVGGTIGGGIQNTIQAGAQNSTIGGGTQNLIQYAATNATVAGGFGNVIQYGAGAATIGGGFGNHIESHEGSRSVGATIAGGEMNTIQTGADDSTIGGGRGNTILTQAELAIVQGGSANVAGGFCSFAAGHHAQALHSGAFVWADTFPGDYASTGDRQFCVRATGGVQLSPATSLYCGSQVRQMLNLFGTNYGIGVQGSTLYFRTGGDQTGNGFAWYRGGGHNDAQNNSGGGATLMTLNNAGLTVNGTFVSASDRNLKENFAAVNARAVLEKVSALPLQSWNYREDSTTRHLGPMAQDFYAAFGVGTDDKHIATVDADGVALAAIQGLNEMVKEKDAEIQTLKRDLAELRQAVNLLARHRDGGNP